MPIGIEIASLQGSDERILEVGVALQALLGLIPPPAIHMCS